MLFCFLRVDWFRWFVGLDLEEVVVGIVCYFVQYFSIREIHCGIDSASICNFFGRQDISVRFGCYSLRSSIRCLIDTG